jgi:thiol-disulfide isomerase/thioredoxin
MLLNMLHSSSVLQEFHLLVYEVWWKLTNVLEEATSSVSIIKMEEPTTSNFKVEKEVMINFYQSTWCHNQDDSSLYRHCYENLKYHSRAMNDTSTFFHI